MSGDEKDKKKSFRTRMGTVMRRTSSIVTLGAVSSRPHSPEPSLARRASVASTSDISSIHSGSGQHSQRPSIDAAAAVAAAHTTPPGGSSVPSPIAESPAREAAASDEDGAHKRQGTGGVHHTSPLGQGVVTSEEVDTPQAEAAPERSDSPKIFQSPTGPGAFVDEPEEMSTKSLKESKSIESLLKPAQDAPPAVEAAPGPSSSAPPPSKEPEHPAEAAPAPVTVPEKQKQPEQLAPSHSPELKTAVDEPSYFDIAARDIPPRYQTDSESLKEAIIRNTMGDTDEEISEEILSSQTTPRPHGPADTENANVFYIPPTPGLGVVEKKVEKKVEEKKIEVIVSAPEAGPSMPEPLRIETQETIRGPAASPPEMPVPQPLEESAEPSRSKPIPIPSYNVAEPQAVWAVSVSGSDGKKHVLDDDEHRDRSVGMNRSARYEDPFADPVPASVTAYPVEVSMPAPRSAHEELRAHGPQRQPPAPVVVLPLPEFSEVIPGRSIREVPSEATLGQGPGDSHIRFDAAADYDEDRPLLNRPRSPPPPRSPLNPQPQGHHHHHHNPPHTPRKPHGGYLNVDTTLHAPRLNISPMASLTGPPGPPSASGGPLLNQKGWIEYGLPDGVRYYVHPTLRVTTDVDLRDAYKLGFITSFLESRGEGAPPGTEMWLREGAMDKKKKKKLSKGKGKAEEDLFVPLVYLVDHKKRMVTQALVLEGDASGRDKKEMEDGLDMEYRYWSYVEDHPAHNALPLNARSEAMDVLTWSWTDRLLPPHGAASSPFTQEECTELSNMLRSFGDLHSDSGINTVVHTRVVARILIRVAQWRQATFRPNKALPQDVSKNHRTPVFNRTLPFRKRLLDFLVSCVCLGIPYIFFNRIQHHRLDEESGMLRGAGPMMVIGACTCLVAAIVLSASVTFLSLPGLDAIARVAGLIAVLLSTFSMVSTIVAVFKYKSDMERTWLSSAGGIVNYGAVGMGHGHEFGARNMYGVGGEGLMLHSRRIMILSLPLTLLIYSIIAFTTGVVLYSFFGTVTENSRSGAILHHHFEGYTRWSVVGVLGGLVGVLFTAVLMLRR